MAAEVFHPAEFIEEELQERGWTVRDLVFRMRRYESESDWARECLAVEMYMVVREPSVLLGKEMAIGFGDAFGVSAQMFLNLHEAWREHVDRGQGPVQPNAIGETVSEKKGVPQRGEKA